MTDFEDIITDILETRAKAVEKFLDAHGVTEDTQNFTLTNDVLEDGTEEVTLWKLEKVATLKLSFTVKAGEKKDG